eukprot:UN28974
MPKILILSLKRWQVNTLQRSRRARKASSETIISKYCGKLVYPVDLSFPNVDAKYKLVSTIFHTGPFDYGHYVCIS